MNKKLISLSTFLILVLFLINSCQEGVIGARRFGEVQSVNGDSFGNPPYIKSSGTPNYIPKFIGTYSIGNSVMYEKNGNVGIGTMSPGVKLEVEGELEIAKSDGTPLLSFVDNSDGGIIYGRDGTGTNRLIISGRKVYDQNGPSGSANMATYFHVPNEVVNIPSQKYIQHIRVDGTNNGPGDMHALYFNLLQSGSGKARGVIGVVGTSGSGEAKAIHGHGVASSTATSDAIIAGTLGQLTYNNGAQRPTIPGRAIQATYVVPSPGDSPPGWADAFMADNLAQTAFRRGLNLGENGVDFTQAAIALNTGGGPFGGGNRSRIQWYDASGNPEAYFESREPNTFRTGGNFKHLYTTPITNTAATLTRWELSSSGTTTTNFGALQQIALENSAGNIVDAVDTRTIWEDATAGSEKGAWLIRTMDTGAFDERMRVTSTGLTVSGDIKSEGIILKSPDGSCFRITVKNDGSLTSIAITCL